MSDDILDRINHHFRGQTFYEGRKPTLLEEAGEEIRELRARLAEAEAALDGKDEKYSEMRDALRAHYDHFHEELENPCPDCFGYGKRSYPSTATWRGGVGGQSFTTDVCDRCWGSGDADRPWPSHRKATQAEADLAAARRDSERLDWIAAHPEMLVWNNGSFCGVTDTGYDDDMTNPKRHLALRCETIRDALDIAMDPDRCRPLVRQAATRDADPVDVPALLEEGKAIGDEARAEMEKSTRLDEVPRMILRDAERGCGKLIRDPAFRGYTFNCGETFGGALRICAKCAQATIDAERGENDG